jgi:GNAT superfamily N-acetyltransferase
LGAIVALLADDDIARSREQPDERCMDEYRAAFAAIEADPNQLLAVADEGGAVLGCLQLSFLPGLSRRGAWRCLVEGVRVAADRRGAGLGRDMMAWAIAQARVRGCVLVQLTSDKRRADAIRFYEKLGFEWTHAGMKLAL